LQQPEQEKPLEIVNPGSNGREKGIWEFWPTVGFSAAVFSVYFAVQSIVAVIFAVNQIISTGMLDPFQLTESMVSNGLMLSLATIFSASAGVGFIILFIKIRKGPGIAEYLGLNRIKKSSILVPIAAVIGLIIISSGLERYIPESPNTQFMIDTYSSSVFPALLWIATVIFAPVFEEGFFRGFLFVGLNQTRLGSIGTVILTSLFWAVLHLQYDVYGIVSILILGFVFGIIRLKTRSLWGPLIMHSIWNLVAMVGTALYVNGIGN